jgi:hypothetical protein
VCWVGEDVCTIVLKRGVGMRGLGSRFRFWMLGRCDGIWKGREGKERVALLGWDFRFWDLCLLAPSLRRRFCTWYSNGSL